MTRRKELFNFVVLLVTLTSLCEGQTVLRDVHFKEGYNVNELPPVTDGKPLQVGGIEHL